MYFQLHNFDFLSHSLNFQIVTNNQKSDVEMDELKNSLLATANLYGPKPELFKLFGRYKKQNNVILSVSALHLKNYLGFLSTCFFFAKI